MKINQHLVYFKVLENIFCHFQIATPSVSTHLSILRARSLEFAFEIELIYPAFYLLSSEKPSFSILPLPPIKAPVRGQLFAYSLYCQPQIACCPLLIYFNVPCSKIQTHYKQTEVESFSFSFSQSCQSSLTLHCVFFLLLLLQCCRSSSLILQSNCCLLKIQKSYECIIDPFYTSPNGRVLDV